MLNWIKIYVAATEYSDILIPVLESVTLLTHEINFGGILEDGLPFVKLQLLEITHFECGSYENIRNIEKVHVSFWVDREICSSDEELPFYLWQVIFVDSKIVFFVSNQDVEVNLKFIETVHRGAICPPLLQALCINQRWVQLHMERQVSDRRIFSVIVEVCISCRSYESISL